MNKVFLDTEYVMASVSQGQVCVCVELCECDRSVLFIFHVSCLFCLVIFTLPRLAVVAQLCLHEYIGTLAKVAQLCLSSRHNFVLAQAKLLYLVHA